MLLIKVKSADMREKVIRVRLTNLSDLVYVSTMSRGFSSTFSRGYKKGARERAIKSS